ncbi:MAG TPA: GNAT family protein [Tepidisphaeraceae bacterium]|jgi:ribosomal-protein-alanine N-acetyltransferase|nr:GNAT family protein [Tepidisphaeraceae bacterium]
MIAYDATTNRIGIRRPRAEDCNEFINLIRASTYLHDPWVDMAKTPERYESYLRSRQSTTDDGYFICELASNKIVGVINLNCIVRGFFQSTYLGYAVGEPYARQGYMTEGMKLVTRHAFTQLSLHRVEANIQPANAASIALVRKCGFQKEGFSPKYLRVAGEWRDHERWALRAEDEK